MPNDPILVIGASGKTGSRVTASLQKRGFDVRAVSRKSKIPFDWNDKGTWNKVLSGIRAVYIVHPGLGSSQASDQIHDFSLAAANAGIKKAVLASTPDDGSDFSEWMRTAEKHIVDSGLNLTSLRLRWFFQNFSEDFLLPVVLSGELRLPAGTGKEAFIDADDIADVAVAALIDDCHNGRFYDLTGPRLLSFADIADEITRATRQQLNYIALTPEMFITEQLAHNVPADWVYTLNTLYQNIAHAKLEKISGDVEAILGKPARDFSDFVFQAAKDGVWENDKSV